MFSYWVAVTNLLNYFYILLNYFYIWRFFWSGAGVSFISGLISAILVWCITKDQKETPTTNIEFPKDSIVIYLRENALKLKDTSLVRYKILKEIVIHK